MSKADKAAGGTIGSVKYYFLLCSRIEHLKSQNDLLTITLEECKSNAERMSMLVGKYESNATALRLALQYRYSMSLKKSRDKINKTVQLPCIICFSIKDCSVFSCTDSTVFPFCFYFHLLLCLKAKLLVHHVYISVYPPNKFADRLNEIVTSGSLL